MVFKPGDKYIVHRFTGKQRDAFLSDPKLASIPNLEAWGIRKFGDSSGYNIATCKTVDGSGDCDDDVFFIPSYRGSLDLNSLRFQLILKDAYMMQGRHQYLKQTNPQEYQKMAHNPPRQPSGRPGNRDRRMQSSQLGADKNVDIHRAGGKDA